MSRRRTASKSCFSFSHFRTNFSAVQPCHKYQMIITRMIIANAAKKKCDEKSPVSAETLGISRTMPNIAITIAPGAQDGSSAADQSLRLCPLPRRSGTCRGPLLPNHEGGGRRGTARRNQAATTWSSPRSTNRLRQQKTRLQLPQLPTGGPRSMFYQTAFVANTFGHVATAFGCR